LEDAEANRVAEEVINLAPNVIFDFGTTEFLTDVLPKIEASWPKATYLVPEGGRVTELSTYVQNHPTMSSRILGTAPGARRSAGYREFELRFTGRFTHAPGNLAEFAYDAAYLIAYAIAISHQARPTGVELAQALRKVTPPCVVDNPAKVPAGFDFVQNFNIAASQGCIDFEGASGPLDFNAAGEADSDIATWCASASGSDPFPQLDTYYDATGKKLVGTTFSCP
jgi:branched-chain amino acid transport system substrate-binding protein